MEVTFETFDRIAIIRLNRPEQRNAVDMAMMAGLKSALARFEEDRNLQVAVLTGAGSVFCAGMDLAAFANGERPGLAEPAGFAGFVRATRSKPIIAAVNGGAFAGGFELMLACDMAIATQGARFGLPEVKRGLVAAGGGALRLPRRIPVTIANEMLLTGDPITAERALELGLLNCIVPGEELIPAAMELAGRIAVNSPTALKLSLSVARKAAAAQEEALWEQNGAAWAQIDGSHDALEGARAFKEKRNPVWDVS